MTYFRRKVLHGEKLGRKLGFPTVNFHVGNFGQHFEPGIYSCTVTLNVISNHGTAKKLTANSSQLTALKGALYFGPKGTGKNVLEIHILDFSEDLYGQMVSFEVEEKIRSPKTPQNLEELKKMIDLDVKKIREQN